MWLHVLINQDIYGALISLWRGVSDKRPIWATLPHVRTSKNAKPQARYAPQALATRVVGFPAESGRYSGLPVMTPRIGAYRCKENMANIDHPHCGAHDGTFTPFIPKNDQCQISPVASPQILHHTVWRTWPYIAYSDQRWSYYQFSLPHL